MSHADDVLHILRERLQLIPCPQDGFKFVRRFHVDKEERKEEIIASSLNDMLLDSDCRRFLHARNLDVGKTV